MTKFYPDYENPTMIYNAKNEYTIIPGSELAAHIAAGWSATPQGDVYTEPMPFTGEIDLTPVKAETAKDAGKSKKPTTDKE